MTKLLALAVEVGFLAWLLRAIATLPQKSLVQIGELIQGAVMGTLVFGGLLVVLWVVFWESVEDLWG